jgi:hypothetical protein
MEVPIADFEVQKISFDASVVSTALTKNGWYRLTATEDCYYVFADTPTATTSDVLLLAGIDRIIQATATKVAAIKRNTAGDLVITRVKLGTFKEA